MVQRRVAGFPLEHVLGWLEFCGLRIEVDPGVFVPRRRTQFLVQQAASLTRSVAVQRPSTVVDLCCGTGAVGLAIVAALQRTLQTQPLQAALGTGRPLIELHASDVDSAAVGCARRNLAAVGGHVYEGDLFDPLPGELGGCVDVLVANAPYVPTEEISFLPPEARLYERLVALDGGLDGLDVVRRIAAGAPYWLRPGGHLLVETGTHQAQSAAQFFSDCGLTSRVVASDALNCTVVAGSPPPGPVKAAPPGLTPWT